MSKPVRAEYRVSNVCLIIAPERPRLKMAWALCPASQAALNISLNPSWNYLSQRTFLGLNILVLDFGAIVFFYKTALKIPQNGFLQYGTLDLTLRASAIAHRIDFVD